MRPPAFIPRMRPLPQPGDPKFPAELRVRLTAVAVECDFTHPKADEEAKANKAKLLKELVEVARRGKFAGVLEEFIAVIERPVFRPLAVVPFPDPEDTLPWEEPTWPHLELHYAILTAMPMKLRPAFALRLVPRLQSGDPRERKAVADLLIALNPSWLLRKAIELIRQVESESTTPLVLAPCFAILVAKAPLDHELFMRAVLPLVRSWYLPHFRASMMRMVQLQTMQPGPAFEVLTYLLPRISRR